MKKLTFTLLLLLFSSSVIAQSTEKVWRLNIINPGIEYEQPVSDNTTISLNTGLGYSGAYPNLTNTTLDTGFNYVIAPFADLQLKKFYNLKKRSEAKKEVHNNSGNFISIRFRTRGKSLEDNIVRKSDFDFAIGPTWGIQRTYNNFHLLLDLGPQFYFDVQGNSGFWPVMPQINIGFDL